MCQRDGGCCGRGFSIETTRIRPTTPATQRRTCSLGNAAVCAPPSPPMRRSIAAKLIRDEPTTIKRCADDIAWASVLSPESLRGRGGNVARVRFSLPP